MACPRDSDGLGQAPDSHPAGDHPESDFRRAQFRGTNGDAQVGGQGQLQSAAESVAGEDGNHRLGKRRDAVKHADAGEDPIARHLLRR